MPLETSMLTRRGPNTNATCETGFQWAEDAAQNSPCLVAAAVVGGCGGADYTVPALITGKHYNPPGVNGQPINGCSCSWAAYNLYSACTACQGFDDSIQTWAEFRADCGSSLSNTTYYPSDVVTLSNTSIPFYATVNPSTWQNAIFNVTQAQNISEQGHADVYGAPLSSSTSTSSSTTSSSKSDNAAAIAGGVVGGVVVLIIGALVGWWILRKRRRSGFSYLKRRSGKPQELDSTPYDTQHTRSLSDLTRPTDYGDASFGTGNVSGVGTDAYMGSVSMQQFGPSPFGSSLNIGSVNSMGTFSTPPHQVIQGGLIGNSPPPSTYNGRASTITGITRYDSPSPSMQFMARSQSPDSSFGHEMSIQPFMLPLTSTSVAVTTKGGSHSTAPTVAGGYENASSRRDSQDSLFSPAPVRRMNPPAYDDAVGNSAAPAFSDSRDVAAQRRETNGTGHGAARLPVNEKSQHLQVQGSQDSSIVGPDLAAIDAYVNQIAVNSPRPGGGGGSDTVPVLRTTAVTPHVAERTRSGAPQRRHTVKTMNTTMDDGANDSVVGDHDQRGEGNVESISIA